ncbi:putative translation Initiation factor eIF-4e, eukaryotic translation initiation factor 4E (eIF-4E) [Helianthus annuus]|nr:putative translation Initiation factor eIF-4e, eukaryotic translation initiation factor 4E (eIF-4E) [Helianthus annuus]
MKQNICTLFTTHFQINRLIIERETTFLERENLTTTMVEEALKTDDSRPIDDTKTRGVRSDGEEDEQLEEGEIAGGDIDGDTLSSSSSRPGTAVVQHPLEHSWTFWFDNPSAKAKQASWGSSMRPIYTFSTVEEFWSLYNNIHRPSKLASGADFYCFKNKIEPKWEDPVCANGGKWTMTFSKAKSDMCWLYTLLAMIGEQFDHGDDICGAVVNVRARGEKISLWTKNAANESAQVSIGKQWKEFLDYNEMIGFIFHEDAKKLDRGAKNKYTI